MREKDLRKELEWREGNRRRGFRWRSRNGWRRNEGQVTEKDRKRST